MAKKQKLEPPLPKFRNVAMLLDDHEMLREMAGKSSGTWLDNCLFWLEKPMQRWKTLIQFNHCSNRFTPVALFALID